MQPIVFSKYAIRNSILRTYRNAEGATKKINDFVTRNKSGKSLKPFADKQKL